MKHWATSIRVHGTAISRSARKHGSERNPRSGDRNLPHYFAGLAHRSNEPLSFSPPEQFYAAPHEHSFVANPSFEGAQQVLGAVIGGSKWIEADTRGKLLDPCCDVDVLFSKYPHAWAERDLREQDHAAGFHHPKQLAPGLTPIFRMLNGLQHRHAVKRRVTKFTSVIVGPSTELPVRAPFASQHGIASLIRDVDNLHLAARSDAVLQILVEAAGLNHLTENEDVVAGPEFKLAVHEFAQDSCLFPPHVRKRTRQHDCAAPSLLFRGIQNDVTHPSGVHAIDEFPRVWLADHGHRSE